jgi:hypothetical protein
MFEFASDHARLGFKLSELALRIVENEELSAFVGKVGSKLSRDGALNQFETAVLTQVFENSKVQATVTPKEIKESVDLEGLFDKYTMNFF